MIRLRLCATGEVQGVGFRPAALRLARSRGLTGFACNRSGDALVEVQGEEAAVRAYVDDLRSLPPPARVDGLVCDELPPSPAEASFEIATSAVEGAVAHVLPPDLRLCAVCAAEVLDPGNRRFGHSFASCTACGPRASIAQGPPFDRDRSTMSPFALCPACRAEYQDPADRRFHAQTLACPDCGPRLSLPVGEAVACLRGGGLVALKGIGGFQLLCDATQAAAVARLRTLKRRPDQPMAVLVADLAAAELLVGQLAPAVRALLAGPAGPIVLVAWDGRGLAPGVAPAPGELGLLLPTSPLHLLVAVGARLPLVCTSGNVHGAPLATTRATAEEALGAGVDLWLDHDRDVLRPLDDSVVRLAAVGGQTLRRGRGLAPRPLPVVGGPAVLGFGAFLECAPALLLGEEAHVAPHVGDLRGRAALQRYDDELLRLLERAGAELAALACDLHPDLPSTRRAERLAAERGLPLLRVQHHHAHVAAVAAERQLTGPLLGLAWDGVGHGDDGAAWGGEALVVDEGGSRRLASLWPIRLAGGDKAAVEPARVGLALLHGAGLLRGPGGRVAFDRCSAALGAPVAEGVSQLLARGVGPLSSSVGRLFDGVAWLLGGPDQITYEGQAAGWLERLAGAGRGGELPLPLVEGDPPRLDWRPLVEALVLGLQAGRDPSELAAAFHGALVEGAGRLANRAGLSQVVLAGGCFANQLLLAGAEERLSAAGHCVFAARALPPGDGGLALGQAQVARWWCGRG